MGRWSVIAGRLPGRTDNEIKNYWNTHIRRKLIKRGIDPTTHRPLLMLQESVSQHSKPHLDPTTSTFDISFTSSPKESFAFLRKNSVETFFTLNEEKGECPVVEEMIPELNLELRISLPYDHPQSSRNGSLGLTNKRDNEMLCSWI
ncbi:unnamed protein product [Thlaspi arvense]|uniref:Uncharacterized protein n=1 Tax=Thlaspi arvense TaxID=13288 RepID=A0AAU9S879_THLAR|nr:unnamed protein product [Thlaspi arvense]